MERDKEVGRGDGWERKFGESRPDERQSREFPRTPWMERDKEVGRGDGWERKFGESRLDERQSRERPRTSWIVG